MTPDPAAPVGLDLEAIRRRLANRYVTSFPNRQAFEDVPALLDLVSRLQDAIAACFDEDGLVPLADGSGDRYYCINPAGQKAFISGIATVPLQALRSLLPREPKDA